MHMRIDAPPYGNRRTRHAAIMTPTGWQRSPRSAVPLREPLIAAITPLDRYRSRSCMPYVTKMPQATPFMTWPFSSLNRGPSNVPLDRRSLTLQVVSIQLTSISPWATSSRTLK